MPKRNMFLNPTVILCSGRNCDSHLNRRNWLQNLNDNTHFFLNINLENGIISYHICTLNDFYRITLDQREKKKKRRFLYQENLIRINFKFGTLLQSAWPFELHMYKQANFFLLKMSFLGGKCWIWFAHLNLNRQLVVSRWKHNFHLLCERNIQNMLIARYFRIQCTSFV